MPAADILQDFSPLALPRVTAENGEEMDARAWISDLHQRQNAEHP